MALDKGENAELLALQRIDETCMQLQQKGKYIEALECMERGLVLRQHFFGSDSDEVWRACKTVGEMCNLLAMTYLQQGAFGNVRARSHPFLSPVLAGGDLGFVVDSLSFVSLGSLPSRTSQRSAPGASSAAEDFAMELELLKKAEILTERDDRGRARAAAAGSRSWAAGLHQAAAWGSGGSRRWIQIPFSG